MKCMLGVLFLISAICLNAQTITSKSSGGAWNNSETWIGNSVPGENNDVVIDGPVSVTSATGCRNITINSGGILQNGGGYGWLALQINGICTNNGIIRNNPDGNLFQIVVWGNVNNNGIWTCHETFFPVKNFQTISQGSGKYFDSNVRLSDNNGYTYNTGSLTAGSDIRFNKDLYMQGYIGGVGDIWQTFDMAGRELRLTGTSHCYRGVIKNANNLYILENAYLTDMNFEGITNIRGRGMILNGGVTFSGTTTVWDTLQNGGGLGWFAVQFKGELINNGHIKNNPSGNTLQVVAWGNVQNNGLWTCGDTYFPAKENQVISQGSGKSFNSKVKFSDHNGYAYTSGSLSAGSDLTFEREVDMMGYVQDVGDSRRPVEMNYHNLTLIKGASAFRGIVKNTNDLTILDDARIWDIRFEGNTTIKGRGRIDDGGVWFKGNITVADTIQNGGWLGWLTVHIDGSLTNNGIIKNSSVGNLLLVEVWGDVHNNGAWINDKLYLPGKYEQHISQSDGKCFNANVKFSDEGGYSYTSGKIIAASDLTFKREVDLRGYVVDVGDRWNTLYMEGNDLTLSGEANIYNGAVKDANDFTTLDNGRINNITVEGNTNIKGTGRIDNGECVFIGSITVIDTLQNGGWMGWITPRVYGNVINYGNIKNSRYGNELWLDVHGNTYNYGTWNNRGINIYTDGKDRIIEGAFNCTIYAYRSGDPAGGRLVIESKMINNRELILRDGIEVLINQGAALINNTEIKENGYITNNGAFQSIHNLEWWSPLNSGLQAEINLVDRSGLVDVTATSYKNAAHPLMLASIRQWLRVTGNGKVGSYKITFHYNEELLNGNDENNLEVYLSPDSGKTWKRISSPLNITRDPGNNTIIVGTDTYPLTYGFGDFILSSGNSIYVPSISAAIGGRKQIRVGPPNRYSISYWNNGDQPTDQFAIVLNTNRGVHIKSVISKVIATGESIELPVDSLSYGFKDEVILIIQPLGPKEVRSFDVVLTSEPGVNISTAMAMEPITFTAVALWIGGAVLEEFISSSIVEGCYEMWRPVSNDKTLWDASVDCVGKSVKKAVNVENGLQGIAEKGAEDIVKKTGKGALWPVFLAKDVFDCMGNTIKGMKDYVNGNFDKQDLELTKVTSWDPNAKEGPGGFGAQGFMATAAPMTYTIFFENKKEATAAAYEITIVDTLDANVYDISSVEFGAMSHPIGTYKKEGNILTWNFLAIELPPNITPPEGEGWVKFTVRLKSNLPTGTQITNRAVIKFDLNPWLATNRYMNTLDFDPPVTTPRTIYRIQSQNEVELIWDNYDGSGSGVKNTMVYMANNDGPFTLAATVKGNSVKLPVEPNITYRFYILSTDNVGNTEINPVSTMEILTGVEETKIVPEEFALCQNYPNPFNPATTISYALPEKGSVELKIYNAIGEEIAILFKENKEAGYYNFRWEPAGLSTGVYIYQIKFNNIVQSKKMIYLK